MATTRIDGPFGTWTQTSSLIGTVTQPSSSRMYWVERYSSDTIRRRKPSPDNIFFEGTFRQRKVSTYTNEYVQFRSRDGLNVTHIRPMGDYGVVGPFSPRYNYPGLESKLHEALKNQKVNLAQALAEYRQTASLFSDLGTRVAGVWRSFRRGDVVRSIRSIRGSNRKWLSSNWLAYQYGVRPLVGDMVNSLSLLDRRLLADPILFRGKVTAKHLSNVRIEQSEIPPGKPVVENSQYGINTIWYAYTVDSDLLKTASSLGLTNPLSLAWELVPYSFVVDWFINVGDYLQSLDTLAGVRRLGIQPYERRVEVTRQYLGGLRSQEYVAKEYYRDGMRYSLPPVRLLWEPSLSWQRITSALALLRQHR